MILLIIHILPLFVFSHSNSYCNEGFYEELKVSWVSQCQGRELNGQNWLGPHTNAYKYKIIELFYDNDNSGKYEGNLFSSSFKLYNLSASKFMIKVGSNNSLGMKMCLYK